MPITYGGIPLTPPSDAQSIVDQWWHGHRVEEFEHPGYFAPNFTGLSPISLPQPYAPRREPPRIGVWSKPTGAARWGVCHLLATGEQLAAIRAIGAPTPLYPLVMTDGRGNSVSDVMLLLPPRPIAQRGQRELYLLTLVDVRWQAWLANSPTAFLGAVAPWSAFLSTYFAVLPSVGLTIDPIPAAYLTPTVERWVPNWSLGLGGNPYFTPPVLDALARTVGLRYVYDSYTIQRLVSATTAVTEDAARWATYKGNVLSGGRTSAADVAWGLPGICRTYFLGPEVGKVEVLSYDNLLTNLAIPAYGPATGIAAGVAMVVADSTITGTTDAARSTYAHQAALDYYNWALSLTDATFEGLIPLPPTGLDDRVEWCHLPNGIFTRVIRMPWSDRNVYGSVLITPPQTVNLLTNACPVFTSGYQTGTVVEYTPVTLPPGATVGTPFCSVNPESCCPVPPPPPPPPVFCGAGGLCGPSGSIPTHLYAKMISGCTLFNGQVVPMTFNPGSPQFGWVANWGNPLDVSTNLISVQFNCLGGSPTVQCRTGGNGGGLYNVSAINVTSCDPFCATITFSSPATACFGSDCTSCVVQVSADPSGTCGNPTSYNCDPASGSCVEVFGSGGAYATLAICNAHCGVGVTSYNCVGGNSCVQIGGSGGTYADLATCQAACSGGGGLTWTPLGKWNTGNVPSGTFSSSSFTVQVGQVLSVCVAGVADQVTSVQWGAINLTKVKLTSGTSGYSSIWQAAIAATATHPCSVGFGTGSGIACASAVAVTALPHNSTDQTGGAHGTSGNPLATLPTTSLAVEWWQACCLLVDSGTTIVPGTWGGSFTDDGQDQSITGISFGSIRAITVRSAYDLPGATGVPAPTITGSASSEWVMTGVTDD